MSETRPTFDDIQARGKTFSDDFIVNGFKQQLALTNGERVTSVKEYMDYVPVDQSDMRVLDSPDELTKYREGISNFIATKLKVYVSKEVTPADRNVIKNSRDTFLSTLPTSYSMGTYFHELGEAKRPQFPRQQYNYVGLSAPQHGKMVDILNGSVPGVRANILVQNQIFSQFIQWRSKNYIADAMQAKKAPVARRIYLNPRIEDNINIFSEIIDQAEAQGLSVAGKFLDRTAEGIRRITAASTGDSPSNKIRGDGMVFYGSTKDAESLLAIAWDVYVRNKQSFEGRKLSRIPFKLAEGFGVGDEPQEEESSLTSHRSHALEQVFSRMREVHGSPEATGMEAKARIVQSFHAIWPEVAHQSGIDAHNIAFNKR